MQNFDDYLKNNSERSFLETLRAKCKTIKELYDVFWGMFHCYDDPPKVQHGTWLYYLQRRNHANSRDVFPLPASLYENFDNIDLEDTPPWRQAYFEKQIERMESDFPFVNWSADIESLVDELAELEYEDRVPEGISDWVWYWRGREWADKDSFRYQYKDEFEAVISEDCPLYEWQKCRLLDDLALLDEHCLENGILGHGDLMNHDFHIIDSFLEKKKDQITYLDNIYNSYLQTLRATFLDQSKVRLYKSPLPENTRLIEGLTIPVLNMNPCGENEDTDRYMIYQDLRHYKDQALWDSLADEYKKAAKARFKKVIRPQMFKDVNEEAFHTDFKPQFISGLYDENRLALIRRMRIYTVGDVKVINLPPAGAYDLPVSETIKVELQSISDNPLVEILNKPYVEIVERVIIEKFEEPIIEAIEIPAMQLFSKRFLGRMPSIEVLPNTDIEVIHEPMERTSLFKDLFADQSYKKVDSVPIKDLLLPQDVIATKPFEIHIPGWDGGSTFIAPPPIFVTLPFLEKLGRILVLEAKRISMDIIQRVLLRYAYLLAVRLLTDFLTYFWRILKKKVQLIAKSLKE